MGGFRVLAAVTAGLAMTAAANAADPAGVWLPEVKKPIYADLISGWYVRGDLGYRINTIGSINAPAPDFVTSSSIDNGWAFGGGGGYKSGWLRSDVTLDYARLTQVFGSIPATPNYYSAKLDAVTILANVYLELGTWAGLTPYIGAGVGASTLSTQGFLIGGMWDTVHDTRKWNLSWALMGGVSYPFSTTLLVDLNYRYLNMGEAATGALPLAPMHRVTIGDVVAHEVRIGLRWMLD